MRKTRPHDYDPAYKERHGPEPEAVNVEGIVPIKKRVLANDEEPAPSEPSERSDRDERDERSERVQRDERPVRQKDGLDSPFPICLAVAAHIRSPLSQ